MTGRNEYSLKAVREAAERIRAVLPEGSVAENEPMSQHTSFRTGGPACELVTCCSEEELAERIGCPLQNLRSTLEEYHDLCEDKYDSVFGKPRKYLRPLDNPPYYAAAVSIGAYGSLGGILTDSDLRVLTEDHEVIGGLYGAGSDVNDIYDGSYVFTFPGNTMGFALNSGRIAGENAASYVQGD